MYVSPLPGQPVPIKANDNTNAEIIIFFIKNSFLRYFLGSNFLASSQRVPFFYIMLDLLTCQEKNILLTPEYKYDSFQSLWVNILNG